MAEIRINKLIKKYNVGLDDIVSFLNKQGAGLESDPNVKVSDEYLPALDRQFGKDLKMKEEAEKVDIKLTEILDKSSKKAGEKAQAEDDEPVQEIVIKSTGLGRIDKPATEVKPELKPEVKTEPKLETVPEPEPEVFSEKENAASVETPVTEVKEEKEEPVKAETESEKPAAAEQADSDPVIPEILESEGKEARQARISEPEPLKVEADTPETASEPEKNASSETEPVDKIPSVDTPAEVVSVAEPEKKEEQPAKPKEAMGFNVVGKIDLSQFDKKPKKRERIAKGSQKVDVGKVSTDDSSKKSQNGGGNRNHQNGGGKNQQNGSKNNQQRGDQKGKGGKNQRGNDRFKPELTEAEQEEMQKQIQKQVKETYARMNEGKKNNFGAKYRKEKRELAAQRSMEEMEEAAAGKKTLKVTEFVTVNDLATLMNNTPVVKVIGACMSLGLMVSINQRLDAETLVLVAEEFGYKVEFVTAEISDGSENEAQDAAEDLVSRPPVITVMGHVDHGKTSLLDHIRKSNVIAGEAGGITQHIGAYSVKLENGRRITFLDTPGHEAFTAMRARGAQMTDLAIIIVAADDAVMPQTVEAINHAQAAGVPMVFAINKIDKPGAFPDTIRRQLSEMNILVEDWGGKFQCQEISAKKGLNVDLLLEKVLLETDLLELKANPDRLAQGAVIESSLDKGRGYLATILVQNGTLRVGDCILSGSYYGRVRSMFNERGQRVTEAGPSTPVSVLGLNGAPAAGEKFVVMADEKEAKSIANKREQLIRIQGIKTQKHMTLEEIGRRIAIGNFKELNVIVKGDVDGSVEALSDSLIKLSTEEVRVNVIHKAVGAISESDILLAEASDAVVVGFQVRPTTEARKVAEKEGIEIRLYSVIYDCINEVKDGIEGMLEPEKKEEITATAEVRQTFKISKVGTIAGCLVKDGKLTAKAQVRLIRDGIVVYTGELASLQRGKDQAKEVPAGMECGLSVERFNDIKEGDIVEAFHIIEIKRTL